MAKALAAFGVVALLAMPVDAKPRTCWVKFGLGWYNVLCVSEADSAPRI